MVNENQNRSVILIIVDQMRADCLSSRSHACVETPNLDRLAEQGVRFDNHFGQCVPCGPARASLMTGLYMKNHRSVSNGTPLSYHHTNIAKEVRKLGVYPTLFGYTDTTPDPRNLDPADPDVGNYEGLLKGFDPICRMESGTMYPWRAHLARKGYQIPKTAEETFLPLPSEEGLKECTPRQPLLYKAEDSDTAFLFDQLIGYLSVANDKQLFCQITPYRPHPPFVAPAPYNTMYDNTQLPEALRMPTPEIEAKQHPLLAKLLEQTLSKEGSLNAHNVNLQNWDPDTVDDLRAVYLGLVSELDHHIGRLLDHLQDSDRLDDTLIVFTSDHGEMLGDHWLFGKNGYFDQTVHVPLIIRDPRQSADQSRGQIVSDFTEQVDVMPTILDWLGGKAPQQIDGFSLIPYLTGKTQETLRDEAFWEFDFLGMTDAAWREKHGLSSRQCTACVIRDKNYKYIRMPGLPDLLFDLKKDPAEFCNLAGDLEYAVTKQHYVARMLDRQILICDRTLTN